ncbi:serine/threonine protein kinase, partial [Nodularia spumigena CS-336/02]|nr:serine/threonine protein kinase [Nodularia spumigena CS-336/02]
VAVGVAVGEAVGMAVGVAVGMAVGWAVYWAVFGAVIAAVIAARDVIDTVENKSIAIPLLLFTAGLGISGGIGCIVGLLNPYILLALSGTGLPLATMLLYPPLQRRRLIAKYRKSEERLIKP